MSEDNNQSKTEIEPIMFKDFLESCPPGRTFIIQDVSFAQDSRYWHVYAQNSSYTARAAAATEYASLNPLMNSILHQTSGNWGSLTMSAKIAILQQRFMP